MISLRKNVLLIVCAAMVLTTSSALADVVLYATSRENSQLLKVNVTTNTLTFLKTTGINFPDSITVDSQGRLVYDLADVSQLRRFDPVTLADVLLADSTNGISEPQDLLLDPGGNSILVSNFVGGTITRTTLTGVPTTTVLGNYPSPEGLAYDSGGHLFALIGFGSPSDKLVQLDPITGAILKSSVSFDPTNTLDALVFDSFTGHLFATSKNGSVIYNVDPVTLNATLVPGSTIPTPDGVITNNNGLLYIASRGADPINTGRVYSFNLVTNTATALTPVPGIDDLGSVVQQPPSISKTFGVANLVVGATTTMTFTITNPNLLLLNGVNFDDTLPGGLLVATPNGLSGNTCTPPGTITATAGSGTVSLAGVTLAAGASCTFTVNVTATALGPQNNCVTVSAPGAGTGNTSCALLTVIPVPPVLVPPAIVKTFGSATILLNASTTLTFTINNTNTAALTGVGFADTLPAGLVVATPNGLAGNTCTPPGTITATAGSGTVSLAGATLAAGGTCTFMINVTGTTVGVKNNSVTVFDTSAGTGNTSTASLTVIGPPSITKAFGAGTIALNGTTSLTFNMTNPNTTITLTGVAFTDTLPAGLVIATPNGLTGSCGGGAITAVAGTNVISLTGATLAPSASCTFSVDVTGIALGPQFNATSIITSTNGGSGPPATALITVIVPVLELQIRYAANLDKGDSIVNLSNAGTLSGADPAGRICVNVYTFDPAEELISCCACPVTPNGLNTLSAQKDLISNTLTPGKPTSIVIKLLASTPVGGTCNAATPTSTNLVRGMRAWGTTLHALPTTPVTYGSTETPFSSVELSLSELSKLTGFCSFIQSIGSGFGICKTCQSGALGGTTH